jgi:hypothetical protein
MVKRGKIGGQRPGITVIGKMVRSQGVHHEKDYVLDPGFVGMDGRFGDHVLLGGFKPVIVHRELGLCFFEEPYDGVEFEMPEDLKVGIIRIKRKRDEDPGQRQDDQKDPFTFKCATPAPLGQDLETFLIRGCLPMEEREKDEPWAGQDQEGHYPGDAHRGAQIGDIP